MLSFQLLQFLTPFFTGKIEFYCGPRADRRFEAAIIQSRVSNFKKSRVSELNTAYGVVPGC
jgi:hypothetical protein